MLAAPLDELRAAVLAAAEELTAATEGANGGGRGSITLERPRRAEFGDYSTNAALLLAPGLAPAPREVAQRLGDALTHGSGRASSASRSRDRASSTCSWPTRG